MMTLPWYKDGLRFSCTQCGKCCTGSPGYVWLTIQDIEAIAKFLHLSSEEVIRRYTRRVDDKLALLEDTHNYDCVFLKGKMCQVYGARPKQCRTFPWWPDNLTTKEDWQSVKQRCEGIDHPNAPLVSLEEMERNLD